MKSGKRPAASAPKSASKPSRNLAPAPKVRTRPEDVNRALAAKKGPVSKYLAHHYRHFNAAALMDAAKAYEGHLAKGGTIKEGPAIVPTAFSCANCGHAGIVGVVPGKIGRCPKCREPMKAT